MEEPGEMSAGSFLFHDTFTIVIPVPPKAGNFPAPRRSGLCA